MVKSKLIFQFRITLLGLEPPIWRRIQVLAQYSFWDLHVAIQDSMGWLDYHLHEFQIKKPQTGKMIKIGIPDEENDCSVLPGWEIPISSYFVEPSITASYDYDFGDGWHHEILLEGIMLRDPSIKYPVCISGEYACPPEDCGGPSGYERLLKILAMPDTDEYKDMIIWLKGHPKNCFPYHYNRFIPNKVKFWNPATRWQIAFGNPEQ